MPMMPKRVKFRKSQRGKMKGNATRGNTVSFGEFGLQALEPAWITARQIEAGRGACMHLLPREGPPFLPDLPHQPGSAHPAGGPHGARQGGPAGWGAARQPAAGK